MTVTRLQGNNKEVYIQNLLSSTRYLIKVIKEDETLKKTKWDIVVYNEIAKRLELIFEIFYFLQKTTDKDKDNFGIYSEIVLSNGGLPEFFSHRQLVEDKNNADEKIGDILESEGISSKKDLAKKWVNIANSPWDNKEHKRNYLLNIIPEKYQSIEFYEKLRTARIFDAKKSDKLTIKLIGDCKNYQRYIISWFNYVLGDGVWNIYIAMIVERHEKRLSIFNRKENKIIIDNKADIIFERFLENHMNSGAFFLAREIDKNFPTIYPERITMFQFGPNFVEGLKLGQYSYLLKNGEYFLTSQREDIENSGKNENKSFDKYKYIWKADKLLEDRFGICSKKLEQQLKETIKIPNMRFYSI